MRNCKLLYFILLLVLFWSSAFGAHRDDDASTNAGHARRYPLIPTVTTGASPPSGDREVGSIWLPSSSFGHSVITHYEYSASGGNLTPPSSTDTNTAVAPSPPSYLVEAYPGKRIATLADFDQETPIYTTNSGASATIETDTANNHYVALVKTKSGGSALILTVSEGAAAGATGVAFRFRGNTPSVDFEATVVKKSVLDKDIFVDPNLRSTPSELKLDSTEWQQAYIPFSRFGFDSEDVERLSQIAFFLFGDPVPNEKYQLDDIAFMRVESDVLDHGGSYTEAPVTPTKLFFSKDELPAIREKIKKNTTLSKVYAGLKQRADSYLNLLTDPYRGFIAGEAPNERTQGRQAHSQLFATAFVGFVEEDTVYIHHAMHMYTSLIEQIRPADVFSEEDVGLQVGDVALPVMIGYDWLNPYMTDEQRLRAKKRVYEFGNWIFTNSPTQHWGQDTSLTESSNWNAVMHAPLGLAALLLEDQPAWEERAIYKVDAYLQHAVDAEGAPRESGGYLSLGSSSAYAYVDALKRIKGVDLLKPHEKQLAGIVNYYANHLYPWGAGSLQINQGDAAPKNVQWFLQLANHLKDPLGYGIYYRYYGDPEEHGGNGTWGVSTFDIEKANAPFIILAWDENVGVLAPQEADLPLSASFVSGHAIARTDWSDEAVVLHAKSDEIGGGWSHADDNSFGYLAFGESILCDPGAHFFHARHHNAMLIDGQGQAWRGPGHDVGGAITRFEDKGEYVAISGDATPAYANYITGEPHLSVDSVLRDWYFIREPEPMLLFVDRASMLDDESHTYSMMLQYGERSQPSAVSISDSTNCIHAETKSKRAKSSTCLLWPDSGLTIKERPDIKNSVTTVEVAQEATDATFVTLVIPQRPGAVTPEVISYGTPEEGMTIKVNHSNKTTVALNWSLRDGLTINRPDTSTQAISTCVEYAFNDSTYTASTIDTVTVKEKTINGCDSVVILELTIHRPDTVTQDTAVCVSYTLNDSTYRVSTVDTVSLTNANGCDSVVILNLTISPLDTAVTVDGDSLMVASTAGAAYQWFKCGDNGKEAVQSATDTIFRPSQNGNYAVAVAKDGCQDTSSCTTINTVSLLENNFAHTLRVYPNPTEGDITIDLGARHATVALTLTDASGKQVGSATYTNAQKVAYTLLQPAGVYFMTLTAADQRAVIRLVKE